MPVVTDYTALLSGSYWGGIEVTDTPVIITYSFAEAPAAYLSDIPEFTAETIASIAAFTAAERAQARDALADWASVCGIVFVEVPAGQGDISFALADLESAGFEDTGGIGFYPFGEWNNFTYPSYSGDLAVGGDIFMNTAYEAGGTLDYGTLLHEIGHAIGLKHPTEVFNNSAAWPNVLHDEVLATDDPALTIMASYGEPGEDYLHALEQDAAAHIYGAAGTGQQLAGSGSGSNALVTWSWDAATLHLTQTGDGGADTIRGSSVTDTITGLGGDDRLFGMSGNDTLTGGDGVDQIDGGAGRDTMNGGAGNDSYLVDNGKDVIVEAANGGYDIVYSFTTYTLGANVEQLQLFGEDLIGRGNATANTLFGDGVYASILSGGDGDDYAVSGGADDTIKGGAGADTMFGQDGNDTLKGDAGVDYMAGGIGDDGYYVDALGDYAYEDADEGTDVVYSTIDWTLGDNLENLRFTTNGNATVGTGNALANAITGAGLGDTLSGLGGNDVLKGEGGIDTLAGGEGNDVIWGGARRDSVTGGAGADDFRFIEGDLMAVAGQADLIADFSTAEDDQIYLNQLDANTTLAGDQAFAFIGSAAFSNVAGQLRAYAYAGTDTMIAGDTNGDGVADFYLRVAGAQTFTGNDLVL